MTSFLASLGLPEIIAGILMLALNAYAVMGGADFGGGVWDLLARGPRKNAQRSLVASAIAPIWEANHVWLIIAIVMLFTAFPEAFATLGTVLHIPLSLMLLGIIFRGSAFVFRSYGARDGATQRRWGRVFAVASTVTPVLLGVIIGAITSGGVGLAAARLPGHGAGAGAGSAYDTFTALFVAPWLAPFPLAVGLFALVLFAYLAAVYLTVEAHEDALREDFRRRALISAVALFACAFGTLALADFHAPKVSYTLLTTGLALPFQTATAIAALTAIWALWTRHWQVARAAAVAQVSLILWGWAFALYPYLIPPALTIRDAAAPRITLQLLLWGLLAGAVILIPSLVYLFRTFVGAQKEPKHSVEGAQK
jgi:cytochrome d ubiquinol oxidase subunit II